MSDEFGEERRLEEIRFFRYERLLGQHHLFGGRWIGAQQAPVAASFQK